METNPNTPAASEAPALEQQQLALLKKMHRMAIIRTIACIAVPAVLAVVAIKVVPQLLFVLGELGLVAERLAAVDFAGLSERINQLAIAGADGLSAASEAMTATMGEIDKINFQALGESVEGLASVVDSLKSVTDGMNRLFGR